METKNYETHIVIAGVDNCESISENDAKAYGNINEWLFRKYNKTFIDQIYIVEKNAYNIPGTHREITYDRKLEQYKKDNSHIEITWKNGYEDYSGYGCRTDGKKARCYIGKSTGWIPIYLQIDNSRSTGGPSLSVDGIEKMRIVIRR